MFAFLAQRIDVNGRGLRLSCRVIVVCGAGAVEFLQMPMSAAVVVIVVMRLMALQLGERLDLLIVEQGLFEQLLQVLLLLLGLQTLLLQHLLLLGELWLLLLFEQWRLLVLLLLL